MRINQDASIDGVLDNRFRRLSPDEDRVSLGGQEHVDEWPADSARDFVALHGGHDAGCWARFLQALHDVDPEMAVPIEHENTALGRSEGLEVAATTLEQEAAALP